MTLSAQVPPRRAVAFCLMLCLALSAADHAATDGRSLLRATVPGAFGVRYLPDRALLTYTVPPQQGEEDFALSLYLPEPMKWGYLDRAPLGPAQYTWDAEARQVRLTLPFGSHRLHLGWAGTGKLPPVGLTIPVTADGKSVGALRARFDLSAMDATGSVALGPAQASLRLELAAEVDPERVSLTCGHQTIRRWRKAGTALVARSSLLMGEGRRLTLRVEQYGLDSSPIAEVLFERVRPPSHVVRAEQDQIPDDAILVEAEDFADSGGTPVSVEPGSHYDEHGGASVFSFHGDGAWLEWLIDVPEAGEYDLYARVACADDLSFRSIRVDGSPPTGLALVQFPSTGGWAHAPGEWWLVKIAGTDAQTPPLELDAGEHRIRFTGVLEHHLNVDYLLLAPHR